MTLALVTAVENALSRVAQEKNNTDGTTTVQLAAGDAAAIKATAEDAQDAPAGEHTDSIIQRFGDVFTKLGRQIHKDESTLLTFASDEWVKLKASVFHAKAEVAAATPAPSLATEMESTGEEPVLTPMVASEGSVPEPGVEVGHTETPVEHFD
jgi:hypothetical protein